MPDKSLVITLSLCITTSLSLANSNQEGDLFSEMEESIGKPSQQQSTTSASGFITPEQPTFNEWATQQRQQYQNYKQAYTAALKQYQAQILNHWQQAELPNKTSWVEYSADMQIKRVIDYKNNEIRLSFLNSDPSQLNNKIEQNLQALLKQTPTKAIENDPVLTQARQTSNNTAPMLDSQNSTPILSELFDDKAASSTEYAKQLQHKAAISTAPQPSGKPTKTTVTIKLPEHSLSQRAAKYQSAVSNQAQLNRLSPSLIYAIMHTESAFNPLARSHVPAYGLMQIVPESAGRDVAMRLYGKDRIFSPGYLYNANNNVQAGATYLNILYYSYLKGINNPTSRLYCTIAAYNTGAGNVAKAFTQSRKLSLAVEAINRLSPQQVYQQLQQNLPYEETRRYLQRVVSRQDLYRSQSG